MSAPALALHDVACTFISKDHPGQRYTAVQNVTLTVGAGEFVAVVGPTGCGKSTLLNVGAGLLPPSVGSVTSARTRSMRSDTCAGVVLATPRQSAREALVERDPGFEPEHVAGAADVRNTSACVLESEPVVGLVRDVGDLR